MYDLGEVHHRATYVGHVTGCGAHALGARVLQFGPDSASVLMGSVWFVRYLGNKYFSIFFFYFHCKQVTNTCKERKVLLLVELQHFRLLLFRSRSKEARKVIVTMYDLYKFTIEKQTHHREILCLLVVCAYTDGNESCSCVTIIRHQALTGGRV